jgi:hypothetical protein
MVDGLRIGHAIAQVDLRDGVPAIADIEDSV